jgi:acetyltransferase-like isoleucine patch superfamily enzyme
MIAASPQFISGSKYHNFSRTEIPIIRQEGKLKRIRVRNDVWIGVNTVIMNDVSDGDIVGADSVVTKEVEPYTVVAGNPARLLKRRG